MNGPFTKFIIHRCWECNLSSKDKFKLTKSCIITVNSYYILLQYTSSVFLGIWAEKLKLYSNKLTCDVMKNDCKCRLNVPRSRMWHTRNQWISKHTSHTFENNTKKILNSQINEKVFHENWLSKPCKNLNILKCALHGKFS